MVGKRCTIVKKGQCVKASFLARQGAGNVLLLLLLLLLLLQQLNVSLSPVNLCIFIYLRVILFT